MTKFEVGGKLWCLVHQDVFPSLEHHRGKRTTGYSIANDQLGDKIEAATQLADVTKLVSTERENIYHNAIPY